MSVKQTGQFSFLEALAPSGLGRNARLDRLVELVKWYRFEKVLDRVRGAGPGRPSYPALLMFKTLLLQSLYGLSDAETEEALGDRLSFRRFVGLSLEDAAPDHQMLLEKLTNVNDRWTRTNVIEGMVHLPKSEYPELLVQAINILTGQEFEPYEKTGEKLDSYTAAQGVLHHARSGVFETDPYAL